MASLHERQPSTMVVLSNIAEAKGIADGEQRVRACVAGKISTIFFLGRVGGWQVEGMGMRG